MKRRIAYAALVLAAGACKLDATVFSGDPTAAYTIPPTVITDSLRKEVTFASGGETLHGYWVHQPGAGAHFTILFAHGKGDDLANATRWTHVEEFWKAGFNVLIFDYRGFGRSTGTSDDETTLFADTHAALAFTVMQPGVTLATTVIYGHSLGSAPAIELASTTPGARALVVEAGFESGQAMALTADPLDFPVTWLLAKPLDNSKRMPLVHMPVLIIHGDADIKIPVEQGRALYALANNPRQLVIVPGGDHEHIPSIMGFTQFEALLRTFTGAP